MKNRQFSSREGEDPEYGRGGRVLRTAPYGVYTCTLTQTEKDCLLFIVFLALKRTGLWLVDHGLSTQRINYTATKSFHA